MVLSLALLIVLLLFGIGFTAHFCPTGGVVPTN